MLLFRAPGAARVPGLNWRAGSASSARENESNCSSKGRPQLGGPQRRPRLTERLPVGELSAAALLQISKFDRGGEVHLQRFH